jgi:hypothetical protein
MTEDRRRVQRTFVLVVARTMSRLVLGRISFVREASGDVQFIQTLKSGLAPISHSYRNPSPALLFLGSSLPKRITPRAIGSLLGAATIAAICVYPDYQENTDNADLLTYPSPGGSMRTQNRPCVPPVHASLCSRVRDRFYALPVPQSKSAWALAIGGPPPPPSGSDCPRSYGTFSQFSSIHSADPFCGRPLPGPLPGPRPPRGPGCGTRRR